MSGVSIPLDLLIRIFTTYLDPKSRLTCERVSTYWNFVSRNFGWAHFTTFNSTDDCPFCKSKQCYSNNEHFEAVFNCITSRSPLGSIRVEKSTLTASHLARKGATLKRLKIEGVRFQALSPDSSVSRMLMSLSSLEQLEISKVSKVELYDVGTCPITEWSACRFLQQLTILSLTDVHFCTTHLCETLPHLTGLQRLRLDVSCYCRPMEGDDLARALAPLCELGTLILENNFPNFRIPTAVIDSIATNMGKLDTLWLTQCSFGDGAVRNVLTSDVCAHDEGAQIRPCRLKRLGLVGAPNVTNAAFEAIPGGQLTVYMCGTSVDTPSLSTVNVLGGFPSAVCDSFWDDV